MKCDTGLKWVNTGLSVTLFDVSYIIIRKKKNMLILKFHPGMSVQTSFFLFFMPGWNFIPAFLTRMSSSWGEILSRQERVKRHFTIDRDDFIPGRVSFRVEISRVNTLSVNTRKTLVVWYSEERFSDQKKNGDMGNFYRILLNI